MLKLMPTKDCRQYPVKIAGKARKNLI